MKIVKLSIIALAMGLFAASCGNGSESTKMADSTATSTSTVTTPPAASPAPDTMAKPVVDSMKPISDTKVEKTLDNTNGNHGATKTETTTTTTTKEKTKTK